VQEFYFSWIIVTMVIFTLAFVLVERAGMGDRQMRVWALIASFWPFAVLAMLMAALWHVFAGYCNRSALTARTSGGSHTA